MSKSQKVWFWIFGAMFLIPEILWSPVLNFLYTFLRGGNIPIILRNNFLISSDYRQLVIITIFLQSLGALLSLIFVSRSNYKILIKVVLSILWFVLFILSSVVFVFLLATANMRIF